MAERGPSYVRQRQVIERGGTLVDVVDSLVEELRTDRPAPTPARAPDAGIAPDALGA